MIEIQSLRKEFDAKGKKTVAVDSISFKAEPGRIYGLLGPNGAGKTTTLRCIATLLRPTSGKAIVDGMDVTEKPREVRDRIGFLTGDMKLSGNLSPRELLRFFGQLNHLDQKTIEERTEWLSSYLGMDEFLDRPVAKLSTGMTQKATIAVSLIHDPNIIMFDEPTSGLDILAAKTVVDFLNDSKEKGKTVILSTHIMSEAEKLCDTIGILLNGELVAEGSQAELIERYQKPNLEEVFFGLAKEKGTINQGENANA
ncbi:MAG: ABC transporter ATP-binding protein [Spirochaetales bacterium]